ncbi:hypothetical protein [Sulfurovum sp.]|uniref:hypothetical protein n=1 Tax=Sulfurovum sp. TaxID=1969726 RepID=UPI00356B36A4
MVKVENIPEVYKTLNSIDNRIITDIIEKYMTSKDSVNIQKKFLENIENCRVEGYDDVDAKTCLDYIALILRFVQRNTENLVEDYNAFCLNEQKWYTEYLGIESSLKTIETALEEIITLPKRKKSPFDLNLDLMQPESLPKINYISNSKISMSDIEILIKSKDNLDLILSKLHDNDGCYINDFSDYTEAMVQRGKMIDFYNLYDNFMLYKDKYNSSTIELKSKWAQIQKERVEWKNKIYNLENAFRMKFLQEGEDPIFIEQLLRKIHLQIIQKTNQPMHSEIAS